MIEVTTHPFNDPQVTDTSRQMEQAWSSWEEVDGDERVQMENL